MKKLKLSDRDARLLIIVIALAILAAVYFLLYNPTMTKAQEIEAENETLQQQVATLESKVARREQLESQTAQYQQLEKEIIAKYPADVTEETAICLIQEMEEQCDFTVSQIGFVRNNQVVTGDGTAESADTEETDADAESGVQGGYTAITVSYEASYNGLKELLQYVDNSNERITIPTITVSYDDETGGIAGTFTMNLYYMTGTEKEYEDPKLDRAGSGVDNIFTR